MKELFDLLSDLRKKMNKERAILTELSDPKYVQLLNKTTKQEQRDFLILVSKLDRGGIQEWFQEHEKTDYTEMTVVRLRGIAHDYGIRGCWCLNKMELIMRIIQHEERMCNEEGRHAATDDDLD